MDELQYFHVTSELNRTSIWRHGLDPTYMGAARGIAGSSSPEAAGVFLARGELEAAIFVGMNNTGGAVDVWAVEGVSAAELVTTGTGYEYLPGVIGADRLRLVSAEEVAAWMPQWRDADEANGSDAYSSTLTVTLDDGTVLRGDASADFVRRQP